MEHVHFGACGCSDELMGPLDLYSLNEELSHSRINCLNEAIDGSGAKVFKPYHERSSNTTHLSSSCDGELIITIPCDNEIKLKAITIASQWKYYAPKNIKIWVNRDSIDFGNMSNFKPTFTGILPYDPTGDIRVILKGLSFNTVNTLTIHLSTPYREFNQNDMEGSILDQLQPTIDDGEIDITYIGLFGNYTKTTRKPVQAVYERLPSLDDHDISMHNTAGQSYGFGL